MNREDELQALLVSALDKPNGLIVQVSGDEIGQRRLAMAALVAAKRKLLPDIPAMINITIKPNPAKEDEIAIIHIRPGELIDV